MIFVMKKILIIISVMIFTTSCDTALTVINGIGDIVSPFVDSPNTSSLSTSSTQPIDNNVSTQKVKQRVEKTCLHCKGTTKCFACHGSGKGTRTVMGVKMNCTYCNGTGTCKECKGKGTYVTYIYK